jgi:hypothetical protein
MVKDIEIEMTSIYLIVGTEERAQMIMEFASGRSTDHASFRTGNAVTFFVKDTINGDIPVQIILKLHFTDTHVIRVLHRTVQSGYHAMLTDVHGMGGVECANVFFPVLANVDFVINVQNHQIRR